MRALVFSLFYLILAAPTAWARVQVIDDKRLLVSREDAADVSPHDIVALVSKTSGEVVAIAEVLSIMVQHVELKIDRWSAPRLVTDDITISRVDQLREAKTDARTILLFPSGKRIPARLKRLYNTGNIQNETGALLGKGEHFADIFGSYSYGINDSWNLGALTLGWVKKTPNLRTKFSLLSDENFQLSLGASYFYILKTKATTGSVSLYYDTITNAKVINHTVLNFAFSGQQAKTDAEDKTSVPTSKSNLQSSLASSSEIILSNWDRLILGPEFFVDTKAVGGFFHYGWIWDRSHLFVGVATKNALRIKEYSPTLFAYWRFP